MSTSIETRGWTEDEAYERLEKAVDSLEGPNCPWHGPARVVVTKSYTTVPPGLGGRRIGSIGWRCRECGNKWGWRSWWREVQWT